VLSSIPQPTPSNIQRYNSFKSFDVTNSHETRDDLTTGEQCAYLLSPESQCSGEFNTFYDTGVSVSEMMAPLLEPTDDNQQASLDGNEESLQYSSVNSHDERQRQDYEQQVLTQFVRSNTKQLGNCHKELQQHQEPDHYQHRQQLLSTTPLKHEDRSSPFQGRPIAIIAGGDGRVDRNADEPARPMQTQYHHVSFAPILPRL